MSGVFCRFLVILPLLACLALGLSSCSDEQEAESGASVEQLTVYKTRDCSCCSMWIDHVQQHGFTVMAVDQDSIAHIKDYYAIPENARACHTSVSESGYIFEGHIPAKYIHQFLQSPIDGVVGLVVPAMPLGSPGMEFNDQFNPYSVYALDDKGALSPYVRVESYAQQFK